MSEQPIGTVTTVMHDTADLEGVVGFWTEILGLEVVYRTDTYAYLSPLAVGGPHLAFQSVPEAKSAKNRLHLDIRVPDRREFEELVVELNADPRRGSGPRSPWTRLEFDDQADRLLADLDMTRSSVPLEGETVYLRRNANTSDGGTAMDVTDSVHPENREIAVRAARALEG